MLPDFGWTELLVISIVLIVVIGPKDLPKVLRGFGRTMTSVRQMAGDFRKQFDDALKEAELDEVRQLADDVRSLDPRKQIKEALDPLAEAGREIDADMKKAMGDTKLPELPKSPPQVGLDQAGAKARAAQPKKAQAGAAPKPAAAADEATAPKPRTRQKPAAKAANSGAKAKTSSTGTKAAASKSTGAAGGAKAKKAAPASASRARSKANGTAADRAASTAGTKAAKPKSATARKGTGKTTTSRRTIKASAASSGGKSE